MYGALESDDKVGADENHQYHAHGGRSFVDLPSVASASDDSGSSLGNSLTASPWQILTTFCIATCGGGVLSLPYATYEGSIVLTCIVVIGLGVVSARTSRITALACALIPSSQYSLVVSTVLYGPIDEEVVDEGDVAHRQRVRNLRTRRFVLARAIDGIIYLLLCLFCTTYLRSVVDSMPRILDHFGVHSGVWLEMWPYLLLMFVGFTPLVSLRSLSELTIVSMVGMVTVLAFVGSMAVSYFRSGGEGYSSAKSRENYEVLNLKTTFMMLPGIAVAMFTAQEVVPQMYFEMRDRSPSNFNWVINVGTVFLTATYLLAGITGYLTFGSDVASKDADGSIVNNYPNDLFWTIMRTAIVAHFVCVVPIYVVNARLGFYRLYLTIRGDHERASHALAGYDLSLGIRFGQAAALMALLCCAAYCMPSVSDIMSFTGAFLGTLFFSFFPGLLALTIYSGVWQGTAAAKQSQEPELYLPSRCGQVTGVLWILLSGFVIILALLTVCGVLEGDVITPQAANVTAAPSA